MLDAIAAFLKNAGVALHLKFDNTNNGIKTTQKNIKKSSTKNKVSSETHNTSSGNISNVFNSSVIIQVGTNKDGEIPESTLEQLKPFVDAFQNNEVNFVAEKQLRQITDVLHHEDDPLVRGLIKFFKPKLTSRDLQLMRTGLYLQFLRDNDRVEESKKLWHEISNSYVSRERTIIKLASAGYFHTYFRPLYKQLLKATNAQEKFEKEFEKILDDVTFAIFVHGNMTSEMIVDKVTKKAIKNIRYGVNIENITLHATGKQSVSAVKDAVPALKLTFPNIKSTNISKGLAIITVTIDYRNNTLSEDVLKQD